MEKVFLSCLPNLDLWVSENYLYPDDILCDDCCSLSTHSQFLAKSSSTLTIFILISQMDHFSLVYSCFWLRSFLPEVDPFSAVCLWQNTGHLSWVPSTNSVLTVFLLFPSGEVRPLARSPPHRSVQGCQPTASCSLPRWSPTAAQMRTCHLHGSYLGMYSIWTGLGWGILGAGQVVIIQLSTFSSLPPLAYLIIRGQVLRNFFLSKRKLGLIIFLFVKYRVPG